MHALGVQKCCTTYMSNVRSLLGIFVIKRFAMQRKSQFQNVVGQETREERGSIAFAIHAWSYYSLIHSTLNHISYWKAVC